MKIHSVNLDFVRPSTVKAAKALYNELRDEVAELMTDDAIAPRFLEDHFKLMDLIHPIAFFDPE